MGQRLCLLLLCICMVECAAPAGAQDITLVVASDTHFSGASPSGNVQLCIQRMNAIVGVAYPDSIGGMVTTPCAAILCGDLCNGGTLFNSASDDVYRQQWSGLNYCFPKLGDPSDNRLHYPTYAAPGNHDYYRCLGTVALNPSPSTVVAQELMTRYGSGTGGIQEGNVCYSFDLGGVHFVCLGRYADDHVLTWLGADLAATPRDTPIVLFLHYNLDDSGIWYTQAEREALAAKLVGHRVVCLLHGHTHNTHCYTWHATPVFDDGCTNENADFGVLRITDSRTTYAQRQVQAGGDYWKWAAQYSTITGYARTAGGPVTGATISASNGGGAVTTGVDGYYSLSAPVGWSGTVTPSKQGIVFSTPPRSYSNIQSSIAGQDYISDWIFPVAGIASSPARANGPFDVTYSGASDDYDLARVELWYRRATDGSWTYSGLTASSASGSFSFAPAGNDIYCFDLVAVDSVGNMSAPASGDGDCHTIYDSSIRMFAITNRNLAHLPGNAAATYLFAAFGRITSADTNTFEIDDGSGMPILVARPAHGLQIGNYVVVCGVWSPTSTPPALDASSVAKLQ